MAEPVFECIRVARHERVMHIELSRPERLNALSRQTLLELNACLDAVEEDAEVRAVVISGAGRAFSSGFDLKEQMERRPSGPRGLARDPGPGLSHHDAVLALPQADDRGGPRRLAWPARSSWRSPAISPSRRRMRLFGEPELKFGAGIVTMLLPWLTGPKQAKEIVLLGLDRIDAATAQRLGIVNRVVPAGTHVDTALRIAGNIAAIDPEPGAGHEEGDQSQLRGPRDGHGAQAGAGHRPRDRVARLTRQASVHGHRPRAGPQGGTGVARRALREG